MVMARLRRLAMMGGPLAVRIWERSSSKSRSRTQCRRSSIPQWPRMMAASQQARRIFRGIACEVSQVAEDRMNR